MSGILKSFRAIQKIFPVAPRVSYPGSTVRVSIGTPDAVQLDPFIFCVYFNITVPYGFPDHPHRGSEAVTYMTDGQYDYEDSTGHKGAMKKGHLQWMTAGKGLIHAERPDSKLSSAVGFQLWMNLPLKEKFCDPYYQEFEPHQVLEATDKNGVKVKVLAGETLGVKAPTIMKNPGLFLDIHIPPNTTFEQAIPKGWNTFNYVYGGLAYYGEKKEKAIPNDAVILSKDEGDILAIETRQEGARVFMASAATCNEPMFNHNSVIEGSQADVDETMSEFKQRIGPFAEAKGWESDIKKYLDTFPEDAREAQGK